MLTMNKDRTKLAFAQEKYYKFKGIIKESHYAMKAKAETKSAWEMAEKKFRIPKAFGTKIESKNIPKLLKAKKEWMDAVEHLVKKAKEGLQLC